MDKSIIMFDTPDSCGDVSARKGIQFMVMRVVSQIG